MTHRRWAGFRRTVDDFIDSASRALRSLPRSRAYPVFGIAMALAAPVGLVIARAIAAGQLPTIAWAFADIADQTATYAYVAASTGAVFAVVGHVVGRWIDRMRLRSITDPLTGLCNRRHFELRLSEEIARSRRHGCALCVLCLDIDALKSINASDGHEAGDHAIMTLSRSLLETVRGIDVVSRIGGDEFAVILPQTSAPQAAAMTTRILQRVSRHEGWATRMPSVSIGIAELDATTDVAPRDMLAAADAALFRAKASGGGCAALARPEAVSAHSRRFTLMEAAILLAGDQHTAANDGVVSHRLESPAECPACRRILTEVCGDSLLQQSWFRFTSQPGFCSLHRSQARGES